MSPVRDVPVQPSSDGLSAVDEAAPTLGIDVAYRLLENLYEQVDLADNKIRALFSGSALLAAALSLHARQSYRAIIVDGITAGELLLLVARGLLMLIVAYSLFAAILALLPRNTPRGSLRSLFFFGHIAATDHDQFIAEFPSQNRQLALTQILSQVHANSVIVQAKHRWAGRAAAAFTAAILVWMIVQIVEFLL